MHEGYIVQITEMSLREWIIVAESVWLLQLPMQPRFDSRPWQHVIDIAKDFQYSSDFHNQSVKLWFAERAIGIINNLLFYDP